ncbi:MAG: YheT family hydrolase, partial [Blastocatellia bacterium]
MRAETTSSKQTRTLSLDSIEEQITRRPFAPATMLGNRHLMTIIGTKRPRGFSILEHAPERREFQTEARTRVVAYCHWQTDRLHRPTALIVHGLEGSADAKYVLGVADKAFAAGFNVLRFNVRGCGGTLHLSPTLYHSGLTTDLHHVTRELIEDDGLPELFLIGFSMGGNQSLKFAGELGDNAPNQLRGICAISPPIDLGACSRSIARTENRIYEIRFLLSLRRTMREKNKLFPGLYDPRRLEGVRHLWDWDDAMQPYNGFRDARDYYA